MYIQIRCVYVLVDHCFILLPFPKVKFWLGEFREYPHRWVAAVDVRRTQAERDDILKTGFANNICCQHPFFCRRIRQIYSTLDELRRCRAFINSSHGLARHGDCCNMNCERQLALIKSATPQRLPFAERLCAAGLLTQWLGPHTRAGGSDPRSTTRSDLINSDAPIEANRVKNLRGGLTASMCYSNERMTEENPLHKWNRNE